MPSRPAAEVPPVLAVQGVTFAYAGQPPVLRDLSLTVQRGELVQLVGPSGCGKSTLLRLLCGLEAAQGGRILLSGRPVTELPPPERRRALAYVGQEPVTVPGSVRDNLLLGWSFAIHADRAAPADATLRDGLEEVELSGLSLDAPADELSVGQRQRLALLRSLVLRPTILLLDEPTSALDRASKAAVESHLEGLCHADGLTLLMVTHRDFAPRRVRPVVVELDGGTLRTAP